MKTRIRSALDIVALAFTVSCLAACAEGVALPTEVPDPASDIPGPLGEKAPLPADDSAPQGGPGHCAVVFDGADFTGVQREVLSGGAVQSAVVSSVVVAPGCVLGADLGAELARAPGYHRVSDLPPAETGCTCIGSTPALAWLGSGVDDLQGANELPLYDAVPVDLDAIGWSERAWTVRFAADAAIVTLVGAPLEEGGEPSLAIVDPAFDEDDDAVIDLGFDLYLSVPVRGYPVPLSERVSVVEASRVSPRTEPGFTECVPGVCDAAHDADPEGAFDE